MAHVQELDDGARVALRLQIDERPAPAHRPAMPDGVAGGEQPVEVGVELPGAVANVLQALMAGVQKITVEGRRVVALLNQFHLQRAGVGQRQGDVHG